MPDSNVLVYLVRRDMRIADNPILHHLATAEDHGFTHLLPVFVFSAHQMVVSGLVPDGQPNPYPPAKSELGGFWRCGPHRAKFIAESVWNLKQSLESLDSGLVLRVGTLADVTLQVLEGLKDKQHKVGAVWMIAEEGVEEKRDERAVASVCEEQGAALKLWVDEKYFVDDRDLNFDLPDLPDIFGTYRKQTEPLREKPRPTVPAPKKSELPPLVRLSDVPGQALPFVLPDNYPQFEDALLSPVRDILPEMPPCVENPVSAHPFQGGEDAGRRRLHDLLSSDVMRLYNTTRNGLLGTEFSTKLSAYLSQGCLTARQVHEGMKAYEDGTDAAFEGVEGYGDGQNAGTKSVRDELLWRDFMRLCARKFKHKLFRLEGFKAAYSGDEKAQKWKSPKAENAASGQDPAPEGIARILERFKAGTTGMGLIDASQRELLRTGYTSNRARQNTATFLAKHLSIDWRYGAEWYEMLLVDYDVCSNWGNWQYVAGVGLDPRGENRKFNPVKQAFDYDKDGEYVRMWVPEVSKLEQLVNVFQAWTASEEELEKVGLKGNIMVTEPVMRIEFVVDGKPKGSRRPFPRRRANGRRMSSSAEGSTSQQANGQADGQPPSGPSAQRHANQGYNPPPNSFRGSYRGRGGGFRGPRGHFGGRGRGGFRGSGSFSGGAPPPQWHNSTNDN